MSQPSFTVDATTNRITSPGYSYDAAGNLMTDGVNTYSYDAEGNVTGISGGTSATFTYDALNQRVMTNINGTTRVYGFNSNGQRATVWDSYGSLVSAQYYVGGQPLGYYLASDHHVRFQHQDWLGTERFRTTYTGTVDGSFTSLPFGDSPSTSGGSDTDVYHYAGLDADTSDMQHATFREYSATQARWLRPDPYDGSYSLGDPQSFNRYSYVLSNPLALSDPTGLFWQCHTYTYSTSVTKSSDIHPQDSGTFTECFDDGGGGDGGASGVTDTIGFGGGGAGAPGRTFPDPSKVGCGTKLPNGQTVGQVINQGRAQLQAIVDAQNAIAQGGGDVNDLRLTGSFGYFVRPGGPTDFKNLFRGQANGAFLGQAGNFAYYAIGSGYLPNSELDAGAGAYALFAAALGKKPFSSLTGPMFSDASAASQRSAGLSTPGCPQ